MNGSEGLFVLKVSPGMLGEKEMQGGDLDYYTVAIASEGEKILAKTVWISIVIIEMGIPVESIQRRWGNHGGSFN